MRLNCLVESLNPTQLENVVDTSLIFIKSGMQFTHAVRKALRQHYCNYDDAFDQVTAEMRRRKRTKTQAKTQNIQVPQNKSRKALSKVDYRDEVLRAANYARQEYGRIVAQSPDLNEVDPSNFISLASEKFGVRYNDVANVF